MGCPVSIRRNCSLRYPASALVRLKSNSDASSYRFFGPVMSYFTAAELDRMLAAETEFDRRFAQIMYTKAVEDWEQMPDQEQQQVAPPA